VWWRGGTGECPVAGRPLDSSFSVSRGALGDIEDVPVRHPSIVNNSSEIGNHTRVHPARNPNPHKPLLSAPGAQAPGNVSDHAADPPPSSERGSTIAAGYF
jgi:hypothetical protein